ncbi:MAG: hypothetical protein WEB88_17735 [Gemmatimonadota bacterium]
MGISRRGRSIPATAGAALAILLHTVAATPALAAQEWAVDPAPLTRVGGGELPLDRVVGALLTSSGHLVVADGAQRIVVLSRSGQVDTIFGASGGGPGEFRAIAWIQERAPDSIVAYDRALRRATIFSIHDGFARTLALEPGERGLGVPELLAILDDGTLLARRTSALAATPRDGSGLVRPTHQIGVYNPAGTPLDTIGTVVGDERAVMEGVLLNPPHLKKTYIAVRDRTVYVADGETFTLRVYDLDTGAERTLRRPHEPVAIPDPDPGSRTGAQARMPAPTHFPAVGGLVIDDAGNIWVGAYPTDPAAAQAWSVFDGAGGLLAEVAMPPGFQPLSIRGELIAGIWRDELDVEHVHVHRYHRSPS